MARTFARGEGADGLFLKTLTECIGSLGAIDPAKAQALRNRFHEELAKDKRVAENPKDALRHEGAILERLFKVEPVVVPAPEPKPDVVISTANPALDDFDFDFGTEGTLGDPINPYTAADGPLAALLEEWSTSRKHPFVRHVKIEGKEYIALGTAVVRYPDGTVANINCTTGAFKKLREADENVLVHFGGRPVSLSKEGQNGTVFFVWLCHHYLHRVFRFWLSRADKGGTRKDDPRGQFRIKIDASTQGWSKVAA
jgi:hypothetical protein